MRPSTPASAPPPTPVGSPAAQTPGTLVRWPASTASDRAAVGVVAGGAAELDAASSMLRDEAVADGEGVAGDARRRAGHAPVAVEAGDGDGLQPRRSPCAATTARARPVRHPVPGQRARRTRRASPALPGAAQRVPGRARDRRRPRTPRAPARPASASPAATAAGTARCRRRRRAAPATTPSPLSSACAPPAVSTPGRSQPGNGSSRSCAPVAISSRRAPRASPDAPARAVARVHRER